jgi:hypothetical protein
VIFGTRSDVAIVARKLRNEELHNLYAFTFIEWNGRDVGLYQTQRNEKRMEVVENPGETFRETES